MRKKLNFARIFSYVFALFLGLELVARFAFGFGDPPLYYESDKYEYFYQPNQDCYTFHNRFVTNDFGMRCDNPSDSDEVRILKIGDSVIHGGVNTDHDSLASTKLQKMLRAHFGRNITILNLSAGSWGVDNAAAFVKEHGDFDADIVMMVFSSHDLRDNMSFEPCVGIHPSFPDWKPNIALWDVTTRYIWPRLFPPAKTTVPQPVNPSWKYWLDRINKNDWHFLFVLHPDTNEIAAGEYNEEGQQILRMLDSNDVAVLPELEEGAAAQMYRDDIHYNWQGQNQLVEETFPWLVDRVEAVLEGR